MYDKAAIALYEEAQLFFMPATLPACRYVYARHPELKTDEERIRAIPDLLPEIEENITLSIDGIQPKEWIDDTLYKYDAYGLIQGLVEYITSHALDHLFLDGKPVNHVIYETFQKGELRGCYSKNYRLPSQRQVTLHVLIGTDNIEEVLRPTFQDLALLFLVDALFFNEDRHPDNIILLESDDAPIQLAPIFDLGESFLSDFCGDYENYEPQPKDISLVYWAQSIIPKHRLQFRLSEYLSTAPSVIHPYSEEECQDYYDKLKSCATTAFVKSLMEVT